MTNLDAFGETVAADDTASVDAWNAAWVDALHFQGDAFAQLNDANETDDGFALGQVFCTTYRILGGVPLDHELVAAGVATATKRAVAVGGIREIGHAEAVGHLAAGNFTKAAKRWDELAANNHDLAAVRFAHDTYLHVGDADGRLASSTAAMQVFALGEPGWGVVASQHAFALEEAGHFDQAEALGFRALEHDPLDLWAMHALAHVYESTEDQTAALNLLRSREATWTKQESLALHIWWHLALVLIAGGQFDEVLDLWDEQSANATTAFRLCDLSSLLWRLELAGVEVGGRWDDVADALVQRPERHSAAFLDLHSALVFLRRPTHPEASAFFGGLEAVANQYDPSTASENDRTFAEVLQPLVAAFRSITSDPDLAYQRFLSLEPTVHRIGGSVAQRDLVLLTQRKLAE